ncbi:hypothetical protein [Deinococcus pimensis]|uniref:hypothetical protein n=1 Tax=Deinococcus pimensis TaxID=309888 RepID=UPI00048665CD|nr:hypothetical protein [Deinococcus pimensis]
MPALVSFGLAALGLGNGLAMPNLNVWLTSVATAERRGQPLGALMSAILLGQFASLLLSQPLANALDLWGAFVTLGVVVAGLTLVTLPATVKRPRRTWRTRRSTFE